MVMSCFLPSPSYLHLFHKSTQSMENLRVIPVPHINCLKINVNGSEERRGISLLSGGREGERGGGGRDSASKY